MSDGEEQRDKPRVYTAEEFLEIEYMLKDSLNFIGKALREIDVRLADVTERFREALHMWNETATDQNFALARIADAIEELSLKDEG